MIFDFLAFLFLQPILPTIFILIPSILSSFFLSKLKIINLKIVIYSLLMDLFFIRPLGFFLFLISFSLLILSFLEKFLKYDNFYELIIFLLFFNLIFTYGFLFLSSFKFNLSIFLEILFLNLIYQLIYFLLRRLRGI